MAELFPTDKCEVWPEVCSTSAECTKLGQLLQTQSISDPIHSFQMKQLLFCQESSYCVRRPYKCPSLNICRARRKSAILPEPTLIDILQSSPAGIQNAREISRNSSKVSGKAILWIKFCQNETSKRSQLGLDCKHRYCTNVAQAKSFPFLLATQSGAHSRGAFRDFRPTYSLWSFKPVCGSMWHN